MNIDIERLRKDLINHFGTAINSFPIAMMDLINIEKASNEKLIEIAIKNNINLNKYIIKKDVEYESIWSK